jgi:hypothetical protein
MHSTRSERGPVVQALAIIGRGKSTLQNGAANLFTTPSRRAASFGTSQCGIDRLHHCAEGKKSANQCELRGSAMLFPPARNPLLDPPIWPVETRLRWGQFRRPFLQIAAAVLWGTVCLHLMVWQLIPPGPWNLLWLLAPFLVGAWANTGVARAAGAFGLLLVWFAAMFGNWMLLSLIL